MKATGHYWCALHDHLRRHGRVVVALNPIQTAQQAKKGIRKRKTGKIDARHIATLIKSGEYQPAVIPDDCAMTARQLTRLCYALGRHRDRVKKLIQSRLLPVLPEFESYVSNPFGVTARALPRAAPTPCDLLKIDPEALTELVPKSCRHRLGSQLAQRIRHTA